MQKNDSSVQAIFDAIDGYCDLKIVSQHCTLRQIFTLYLSEKLNAIQHYLSEQKQQRHLSESILNQALNPPEARWEKLMNPTQHIAYAVELFQKGAFIVLVDEQQIVDIDQTFPLAAHSTIQFIRLTPLTGRLVPRQ